MDPRKNFSLSAEELSRMRDQTFVWHIDLPPDAIQDEEMTVLEIEGTLTLKRQLNVIRCSGDLQVRLRLVSDQTLESYESELPVRFEESLEVVDYLDLPEKFELSRDEVVEQVRPEDPINLVELLRQYIILSLPMQKMDPENCYNETLSQYAPREAEEAEIDPTWDAIRNTVASWEPPSEN